jgi:hypothetical protein
MKRRQSLFLTIMLLLAASWGLQACNGGGGGDEDADADVSVDDAAGDEADAPDIQDAPDGDAAADGTDLPIEDVSSEDISPDHYHPECIEVPLTQVIGNWDVVPFQVFDGTFKAGVVAFHEQGVDVVFSVNGVEAARAQDPELNDRTGVFEYWLELSAADYADGPVTLSATVEPDCPGHTARDLDDLVLYANAGGSLTNDTVRWADCGAGSDETGDGSEGAPYATVEKAFVEVGSGGTVHLKAGTCYALTSLYPSAGYDMWTTVRSAPGLTRDDVHILTYGPTDDSTGRFGETMVRWKDVSLYKDVDPGFSTIFYYESGDFAWVDGTAVYDARGQWNGGEILNGNSPYRVYFTDAVIRDIMNAGHGFGRNVTMENIGSDVFRGSTDLISVNLTVYGIDSGTTDAHPDFIQFYNPDSTVDNVILYNSKVYDMGAQGIFGGPGAMRNVAFVNLLMEKDPPDSALTSQLTGDWDHMLMWHITTVDAGMMLREPDNIRNVWVVDNNFANLHAGSATELPGWTIDHNHVAGLTWEQTEPMGTSATVGDPLFADEPSDDYRITSDSPAYHTGIPLAGVPADVDGNLYDAETPSLGAFASP